MISVEVRDVSLSFGKVEVLKKLNLEIAKGEFLVLLGPSGCGKSTLLNCIAGLLDVTTGQIFISGRNVTWAEPAERGIGMVFQSYALYPQMSVKGNLTFGLKNAGVPRPEIEVRVARAAEILQIGPFLDRKPAQLSGGQRQRVAIGRALVREADVFLFDEPLSNLDAKLRTELRVELKRLHQRLGNTMIYVTHDQIEAMTLADRIAVMRGGVVQQLDSPMTIYNRPKNLYVAGFIGSPAMNFIEGTVERGIFRAGSVSVVLKEHPALSSDARMILGVRPENVLVSDAGSAPDTVFETSPAFEAMVDVVEPMGADSLLWLTLNGQTVACRAEAGTSFSAGQPVTVRFRTDLLSLFDKTTGERIEQELSQH